MSGPNSALDTSPDNAAGWTAVHLIHTIQPMRSLDVDKAERSVGLPPADAVIEVAEKFPLPPAIYAKVRTHEFAPASLTQLLNR